jgi:DNA-binding MarR family transcriptional regulator
MKRTKSSALEMRQDIPAVTPKRPLESSMSFLVRDVARAVGKELGRRIEPHGIGVSGWLLLRCIAQDEGLSQRELSKKLGVMEPSSLELLLKLEEQGLVTRTRSDTDRRKVEIRLSPKGRALFEELWIHAEEVNDIINGFGTPQEADTLKELLYKVRRMFP